MSVEGELDVQQRTSFLLSILLLTVALPLNLYLLHRIYTTRPNLHVLHLAMAWLLAADLLMIVNYTFHHTKSIIQNSFTEGVHCQISGFVSLICVVFSNLSSTAIAMVTKRSLGLQSRTFATKFREHYNHYTVGILIPGLLYASLLSTTGQVGNYRGLYCCMNDSGNKWLVWSGFTIFFGCAVTQCYFYYSSYLYVKRQMSHSQHDTNLSQEERTQEAIRQKFVSGIRRHAFRMSGLFYIAWFPMMLGGLVAYGHGGILTDEGEAFPRAVDVFIVLCVKVVPILDGLVVWRSLEKASANSHLNDNLDKHGVVSHISQEKDINGVAKKSHVQDKDSTTRSTVEEKAVQAVQITFEIDEDDDEHLVTRIAAPVRDSSAAVRDSSAEGMVVTTVDLNKPKFLPVLEASESVRLNPLEASDSGYLGHVPAESFVPTVDEPRGSVRSNSKAVPHEPQARVRSNSKAAAPRVSQSETGPGGRSRPAGPMLQDQQAKDGSDKDLGLVAS
eukprot:gb/GEZN01006325.1/.p1 GENE.gb/GEZN01006325.1/~~gb/GEZN01006325.1/.p1  ORF type:complete len:502 (-),score=42.26 gb/GEZN01006325.1/:121-1626(-)